MGSEMCIRDRRRRGHLARATASNSRARGPVVQRAIARSTSCLTAECAHWMLCVLVKLGRMRVLPAKHCARELDHSDLESQADAKVGHTVLARVLCGKDLALDAAIAKAARNENAVRPSEQLPRGQVPARTAHARARGSGSGAVRH